MNSNGIMADIKDMLHQGLSSTEIIAKGYARSTVYRVQGDVRGRRRKGQQTIPMLVTFDPEYQAERAAETLRLRERVDGLETHLIQVAVEAERLQSVIQGLEMTVAAAKEREERFLNKMAAAVNKMDGELNDLAKIYKDDVVFGKPKWQRHPQ